VALRVTAQEVEAIIETTAEKDVQPFIVSANRLTNYVLSKDSAGLLTSDLLIEIELNLAAFYYDQIDPQYDSKSTGRSSAKFQGQYGMGLSRNKWGQNAIMLDVTGTLKSLSEGVVEVGLTWLGKPEEEMIPWEDRN
jgi:hypothetical protein